MYLELSRLHPTAQIVVTGEDAGAALAVSLTAGLRDSRQQLPAGLLLVSPFADLSVSSASMKRARGADGWLTREFATAFATAYVQHSDYRSADVSPIHASLDDFPPLLIAAAENEALADDALALAASARSADVEAEFVLVPDSVHSFILFPYLAETTDVLKRFAGMLTRPGSSRYAGAGSV